MKKIFMLAVVVVSATMIACKDTKKDAFPLYSVDPSNVETTTITDKGSSSSNPTTPATTPASTEQTGSTVSGETSTETAANTETSTQESSSGSGEQNQNQEQTQEQQGSTGGTQETTPPAATQPPADENNDTTSNEGFEYATVKTLNFDLSIMDAASAAIAKASVNVNSEGEGVTSSISDDAGKAAFSATINQTTSALEIVVEHPDYVSKTITIENAQDLATISRVIYLEKKKSEEAIADSDKDGVADDKDEFPNDPALIASVTNQYTIAFEDLYPNKGDADFNDLVVKFGITEYINPENKISKINIRSKTLAAGAGYKNKFYINVLGNDYLLIEDPKGDLNQKWNAKENEKYVDAKVHSLDIVFENPVARTEIAPMPYDPFIMANSDKNNQVHLPFVTTKFVGKVLDTDKFPWAVLVPDEWMWPYESSGKKGSNIFKAYPEFEKWYQSQGKEYQNWYSNPDTAYTFPVPSGSALTAYLIKNRHVTSIAAISALIGVMITAVVLINIRRRKLQKGA